MLASVLLAQTPPPTEQIEESARSIAESFAEALPRIGVAVAVAAVFFLIGLVLVFGLRARWRRSRGDDFARVIGRLVRWLVNALGIGAGLTVLFPSVQPVDMLAGLGVFSIAAGFAFQDILQNLLAGVLILFRQPFEGGDQIHVGDHAGTVERITIRETQIRTFDGQRVLIPNAEVYQSAVRVQTAFPSMRTILEVGVDYDADLEHACSVAIDALRSVDDILDEPQPQAHPVEFAASAITIELWYWTQPVQAHVRTVLGRAVVAVKRAFDAAGIEIPFDIRTLEVRRSFVDAVQGAQPGSSSTNGDLRQLTREELYERARAADIEGRSQMTKDELIAALRNS